MANNLVVSFRATFVKMDHMIFNGISALSAAKFVKYSSRRSTITSGYPTLEYIYVVLTLAFPKGPFQCSFNDFYCLHLKDCPPH